jgi:hypothetical protein
LGGDQLLGLVEQYDVNPDWLLWGEGHVAESTPAALN